MVTMFLVSDPDAGDTHSFTLLGNPGQKFSLNTQGQLSTAKGILRCPYSCCPIPRNSTDLFPQCVMNKEGSLAIFLLMSFINTKEFIIIVSDSSI